MREIKFRAWDKERKRMFQVWSIYWYSEGKTAIDFYGIGDREETSVDGDQCVLMQFTGLKDKNGKEIYEGDIVLCADGGECFPEEYNEEKDEYFPVGKYEVVYQGAEGYPAFDLKDDPCEDMNGLGYAHSNSIEVIGNIYEHPELLKGSNDH